MADEKNDNRAKIAEHDARQVTTAKRDWKCNDCNKKIDVAFQIRLCDDCLNEFERVRDEKIAKFGKWKMTDEEHARYFLPHPENKN